MKNKVTVTRAPRLNLVLMKSIQCRTYCCEPQNGNIYYTQSNSFVRIEMGGLSGLVTISWLDAKDCWKNTMVHKFESFEDMCKWVANGKRLEDLQDDTERERMSAEMLESGKIFSCNYSDTTAFYAKINETHFLDLETGEVEELRLANVWPLRAGDAITIEITE